MNANPVKAVYSDLGRIANQACSGQVSSSRPSSLVVVNSPETVAHDVISNRTVLLHDLAVKVNNSRMEASALGTDVSVRWTSAINQDPYTFQRLANWVAVRLRITFIQYESLNQQQNQLVHLLLQASRFVLFLENQETHEAYGEEASRLTDLKGHLQQVVCSTRHLLTHISDDNIQRFVDDVSFLQINSPARTSHALRRGICSLAIERMANTLSAINPETF
ncbi:hypothetical protein PoB_006433300 [Plakobranchus ocellatus]|uniref:Uncharacterized protein n=1 Tax=Plakobranchus ocellatus TaxID=259542 RepID=A0AAV4D0W1_9GAST|nr:hypothetical protein PoB_006433300 [Plakobranchus ocellatus]